MKNLKYNNRKCEYEGIIFDSEGEMERYIELMKMQEEGKISNLRRQVKYELLPKTTAYRKIDYIADFSYNLNGSEVVEDVKSKITANDKVFRLKRKLFYWRYHNDIQVFIPEPKKKKKKDKK